MFFETLVRGTRIFSFEINIKRNTIIDKRGEGSMAASNLP
jgi:hypothetical protein